MPLAEGVTLADDVLIDITRWQPGTAAQTMALGTTNTMKALAGETVNVTPLTILGAASKADVAFERPFQIDIAPLLLPCRH